MDEDATTRQEADSYIKSNANDQELINYITGIVVNKDESIQQRILALRVLEHYKIQVDPAVMMQCLVNDLLDRDIAKFIAQRDPNTDIDIVRVTAMEMGLIEPDYDYLNGILMRFDSSSIVAANCFIRNDRIPDASMDLFCVDVNEHNIECHTAFIQFYLDVYPPVDVIYKKMCGYSNKELMICYLSILQNISLYGENDFSPFFDIVLRLTFLGEYDSTADYIQDNFFDWCSEYSLRKTAGNTFCLLFSLESLSKIDYSNLDWRYYEAALYIYSIFQDAAYNTIECKLPLIESDNEFILCQQIASIKEFNAAEFLEHSSQIVQFAASIRMSKINEHKEYIPRAIEILLESIHLFETDFVCNIFDVIFELLRSNVYSNEPYLAEIMNLWIEFIGYVNVSESIERILDLYSLDGVHNDVIALATENFTIYPQSSINVAAPMILQARALTHDIEEMIANIYRARCRPSMSVAMIVASSIRLGSRTLIQYLNSSQMQLASVYIPAVVSGVVDLRDIKGVVRVLVSAFLVTANYEGFSDPELCSLIESVYGGLTTLFDTKLALAAFCMVEPSTEKRINAISVFRTNYITLHAINLNEVLPNDSLYFFQYDPYIIDHPIMHMTTEEFLTAISHSQTTN